MAEITADDRPFVSVMMPVYNGEKTIERAIKSLLIQTYSNWICIIVNDGSNDGTADILRKYDRDKHFKIIHLNKNVGRGAARQVALGNAEGEYLAFLDADDLYHPEKLEKQVASMEKNQIVDLVSCANASFDADFNIVTVRGKGKDEIRTFKLGDKLNCVLRTSLLRTHLAKQITFNSNLNFAEDTSFIVCYLKGKMYTERGDVLYYYSEFVSVTKSKILITNIYGIKYFFSLFKENPFFSVIGIMKNIAKITIKIFLYPFVSPEFYLKKRGDIPTEKEISDFKRTLSMVR